MQPHTPAPGRPGARPDPLPAPRSAVEPPVPARTGRTGRTGPTGPTGPTGSGHRRRRWWDRRRRGDDAIWRSALAVLDASADAVLGVDADGTVVFSNSVAATLLDAPREHLVGGAAADLVPGLPAAMAAARTRLLDGTPVGPTGAGLGSVARSVAGAPRPVAIWCTPFSTPDGGFVVAVTLRDLRPQQDLDELCLRLDDEAKAARETVGALLRAVTDRAVVLVDPDGRVTRANRVAEKMLGYRADELVGRPATGLSDPADVAEVRAELGVPTGVDPLLALARWGLPSRQDWDFVTKDGRRCPVSLAVSAVGDRTQPVGYVWVASDRSVEWQPAAARRSPAGGERLLLDLDDAATRVLSWGVGRGARPSA